MKRVLTAAIAIAVAVIGPATVASAAPGAAPAAPPHRAVVQSCVDYTPATVFGGYRAQSVCNGSAIDGFGTTASDAIDNRAAMQQLGTVLPCSMAQAPAGVDGGYRIGWVCGQSQAVTSWGSTLTFAGINGHTFGAVAQTTGTYCIAGGGSNTHPAGIRLQLSCNSQAVENYGSTLSDAAQNAAELALIGGRTGYFCGYATLDGLSGGYRLTITCSFQWSTQGWGDNLTQMGHNVINFVALGAYHGKRCATVGITNSGTQKQATASCVPGGSYVGIGPTVGSAAHYAYVAAA